jgi:hypothetical protein
MGRLTDVKNAAMTYFELIVDWKLCDRKISRPI